MSSAEPDRCPGALVVIWTIPSERPAAKPRRAALRVSDELTLTAGYAYSPSRAASIMSRYCWGLAMGIGVSSDGRPWPSQTRGTVESSGTARSLGAAPVFSWPARDGDHRRMTITTHTPPLTRTELWRELAQQLRVDSIRATAVSGAGHPTSAMSAADLVAVLAEKYLR